LSTKVDTKIIFSLFHFPAVDTQHIFHDTAFSEVDIGDILFKIFYDGGDSDLYADFSKGLYLQMVISDILLLEITYATFSPIGNLLPAVLSRIWQFSRSSFRKT